MVIVMVIFFLFFKYINLSLSIHFSITSFYVNEILLFNLIYKIFTSYLFLFFLSKKYNILKPFQRQNGVPKYRYSHAVIIGLSQQRGNQSSQQISQHK